MPARNSIHYGYLLDISKTVEDVLLRSPELLSLVRSDGFAAWDTTMFVYAAETYEAECGLPFGSIGVRSAWIGGGRRGLIWILPPAMRKKNLSLEDKSRLETFQRLIGTRYNPAFFYSIDQPEPLVMRQRGPLPQDVEDMLWEPCYNRFKSREILAESLVEGTAKLALITEAKSR